MARSDRRRTLLRECPPAGLRPTSSFISLRRAPHRPGRGGTAVFAVCESIARIRDVAAAPFRPGADPRLPTLSMRIPPCSGTPPNCDKLSGMRISERVRNKASTLLAEAPQLFMGAAEFDGMYSRREAWVASACQLVELLAPSPLSPYRRQVQSTLINAIGLADTRVDNIAAILRQLIVDVDDGLLDPIEAQARSVVFRDFLDHADHYLRGGSHSPAGVIAGVVFEDTIRRACDRNKIAQRDVNLDQLVSELRKADVLSDVQAARARSAAATRTKATHAQWDEFTADDVRATLVLTRELVRHLLGA